MGLSLCPIALAWSFIPNLFYTILSRSPKSNNIEFMQNCDLPPPVKVFCGSVKLVLSSMNRVFSMMGREEDNRYECGDEGAGGEKVGVLKALDCRKQGREKKALELTKEKECISKALLRESLQVLGYKQCVRVLEVEVMKLKQQWKEEEMVREEKKKCCENGSCSNWIVALVLCFGIAGVGIAFGYK